MNFTAAPPLSAFVKTKSSHFQNLFIMVFSAFLMLYCLFGVLVGTSFLKNQKPKIHTTHLNHNRSSTNLKMNKKLVTKNSNIHLEPLVNPLFIKHT